MWQCREKVIQCLGQRCQTVPTPLHDASLEDPTQSSLQLVKINAAATTVSLVTEGRCPHPYSEHLRSGQLSLLPIPLSQRCIMVWCNRLQTVQPPSVCSKAVQHNWSRCILRTVFTNPFCNVCFTCLDSYLACDASEKTGVALHRLLMLMSLKKKMLVACDPKHKYSQ